MRGLRIVEFEAGARPWAAASSLLGQGPATVFFDHQTGSSSRDGFSILLSQPIRWIYESAGQIFEGPGGNVVDDPVAWMADQHQALDYDGPLPFVGGLAGVLGFEFGWRLNEPRVSTRRQEKSKGQLWVGVFEAAAVFDHSCEQWSVVGRGEEANRLIEAVKYGEDWVSQAAAGVRGREVSADRYASRVEAAVEAIYAGEFFEVNYTERFFGRWKGDRRELYDRLRRRAPGDYGGLMDTAEFFLASISPEQFLVVDGDRVVTRPIKGTRPRGKTKSEDEALARELMESAKDRAENVMIVDLMRNDLTRVCRPGSVKVSELCGLHSFSAVHHLVSTVEGRLAAPFDALDAVLASFPAGSITGAPKLRSMEWIAENEASPRGPYTGSLFYWSDHGRLDSNVLIRTAMLVGEDIEYGAGGAVVADSDPLGEYEEALWKAQPYFEALEDR